MHALNSPEWVTWRGSGSFRRMAARLTGCGLFEVPAELVAHGGEEFVGEVGVAAGAETLVEGGGEDGCGDAFIDAGSDRPAAFAGVGDAATEFGEFGVFG